MVMGPEREVQLPRVAEEEDPVKGTRGVNGQRVCDVRDISQPRFPQVGDLLQGNAPSELECDVDVGPGVFFSTSCRAE